MNQVVHIFRKDCRSLWSNISAVLVLTFLNGYGLVIIRGGTLSGPPSYVLLLVLAGLSWTLLPIALFLLVVSVIQEEGLVGSDKFWLTRPYSRRNLFLEKLLFVLVWAVLPMLLHDIVLIRYFGFSLTSAVGLLFWKTAQFGLFLLIAAALAVLSVSLGRAVVLGFAAALIGLLTFFVVMQNSVSTLEGTATYLLLTVLAVAAVGALAVVAFQYRFRITPVAAVIGVIAILACAVLVRFWPERLVARWASREDSPVLQSVRLHSDASLKGFTSIGNSQDDVTRARTSYYPFQAVGLSDNVGVDLAGVDAHFESAAQKPVPVYLAGRVRFQPQTVGSGHFADPGGPAQLVPFALSRPGDFEQLKDVDGTVSGKLFLQGFETVAVRLVVQLPTDHQEFAIAGRRCTVDSFLRESDLTMVFDCVELEPGLTARFEVRLPSDTFQVAASHCQGQPSSAGSWPALLSPIARSNFSCTFTQERPIGGLPREFTQRREMYVYSERSLGQESRDFRVDDFRPADLGWEAWRSRLLQRPAE